MRGALIFLLVSLGAAGCSRTATIAPGLYEAVDVRLPGGDPTPAPSGTPTLLIARDAVTLGGVTQDASPLPQGDWPRGCPTQLGDAAQETWQIDGPLEPLGDPAFDDPHLTAACGMEGGPASTAFLTDGPPGDGGDVCGDVRCVRYQLPFD